MCMIAISVKEQNWHSLSIVLILVLDECWQMDYQLLPSLNNMVACLKLDSPASHSSLIGENIWWSKGLPPAEITAMKMVDLDNGTTIITC
jgi:hypothetical protein